VGADCGQYTYRAVYEDVTVLRGPPRLERAVVVLPEPMNLAEQPHSRSGARAGDLVKQSAD
jgi:hypothetical protein